MHNRTKVILLILAVCLILLQASAISRRSFWEDETATAFLARMDYEAIVRARAADNHPPLYWLSVAAWGRLFGYTEASLKSYSLIWLVMAAVLVFAVANVLYGERAAIIAVALMVFSPYVLTYGHHARYYAMSAAISLLLAWLARSYWSRSRWVELVFFVAAGVTLLYTMYVGAAVLIALNLWYLGASLRRKIALKPLAGWVLAQILIGVCYLPWIQTFIAAAGRNLDQDLAIGNPVLELLIRFGYIGYAFLNGEFLSPLNPLVWLLILLFILVTLSAARKILDQSWLPITVIGTSLTISVLINLVSVYPQSAWQNLSNRTFFVFPFFVIFLAAGLTQLRLRLFYLGLGVIGVVYFAGIFNYFTDAQMVKPLLAVPWQSMMLSVQVQKSQQAVVLCSGGDTACSYYLKLYNLAPADSWNRERILSQPPVELWWIQNNVGNPTIAVNQADGFIDQVKTVYAEYSIANYAPQDRSIRAIKTDYFGQIDYEYRVSVYHFSGLLQP